MGLRDTAGGIHGVAVMIDRRLHQVGVMIDGSLHGAGADRLVMADQGFKLGLVE